MKDFTKIKLPELRLVEIHPNADGSERWTFECSDEDYGFLRGFAYCQGLSSPEELIIKALEEKIKESENAEHHSVERSPSQR